MTRWNTRCNWRGVNPKRRRTASRCRKVALFNDGDAGPLKYHGRPAHLCYTHMLTALRAGRPGRVYRTAA